MAIFSRRTLQRLIEENDAFLSKAQTRKFVQHLNGVSTELTLAYEWEVVLLNALSKVGKVMYERNFGGSKRVDIYFETLENSNNNFVADITAVSDKGLNANNPYDSLRSRLNEIVKKSGLRANSFNLQVGRHAGSIYKGGGKVKLKIPGSSRFAKVIFNESFQTFIREIIQNPNISHSHAIKTAEADVIVSYNPNQKFALGEHPSYTVVNSLTENTIYQALDRKISQLKGSNFQGPHGIILCDGGCNFFNSRPTAGLSYSIDEVIKHFCIHNEDIIDFVLTVSVGRKEQSFPIPPQNIPYVPLIKLYIGRKLDQIGFNTQRFLKHIKKSFPRPESDPSNALNFLKGEKPNLGRSKWGGMELRDEKMGFKVKVSGRAILELLAGEVDQKTFYEHHGFVPSGLHPGQPLNPFKTALSKGYLIRGVSLNKSVPDDDDWIEFELNGPDPAISPFVIPDAKK